MIGLLTFVLALAVLGVLFGAFKISNYTNEDDDLSDKQIAKSVVAFVLAFIIAIFQPMEVQRIDAGKVGLAIDRIGNDKGVPVTRNVKGWVWYNSWVTDVIEYSIRQQHVDVAKFDVAAKGGTLVPVCPSFNISLRPDAATQVYIHLTKDEDVIGSIKEGWLKTATNIALTNATNNFMPDSIFNNADNYRAEVEKHLTKQLGKYFIVEQVKPGQQPPASMVQILQDKANSIQAVQQAELNRRTAVATAETKIAEARGDSAALVIASQAEAEAIKLKTREISPSYVDYIKWLNAGPEVPRVPNTMLGSSANILLNK